MDTEGTQDGKSPVCTLNCRASGIATEVPLLIPTQANGESVWQPVQLWNEV